MKLDVRLDEIKNAVEGIADHYRKKDYYPAFKKAQEKILASIKKCFDDQVDPSGEPWPKYTDSTIREKEKQNINIDRPLVSSGELYERMTSKKNSEWNIRAYRLVWRPSFRNNPGRGDGLNWKIKIHNEGYDRNFMYNSKSYKKRGNYAPIPARRFLPNEEEMKKIVEETFKDMLTILRSR